MYQSILQFDHWLHRAAFDGFGAHWTVVVAAHAVVFGVLGLWVGSRLTKFIRRCGWDEPLLSASRCISCQQPIPWFRQVPLFSYAIQGGSCINCRAKIGSPVFWVELLTGLLFAGFAVAVLDLRCQQVREGGHTDFIHYRLLFHLVLVALLIAATAIDFELYLIPDRITLTGVLIALIAGTLQDELFLLPIWVDWNNWHPLEGPYIPQWTKDHPHWHGLACSVAGLVTGSGVTWLLRIIARRLIGYESLGFGDVTLMAMIGSFIGWQAVLMSFCLAPLAGVVVGLLLAFTSGRIAVPYGPYLSLATLAVLLSFRWIWRSTQEIFGHVPTLLGMAAGCVAALVVMLILLRLYRSIPTPTRRSQQDSDQHEPKTAPEQLLTSLETTERELT